MIELQRRFSTAVADVGLCVLAYDMGHGRYAFMIDGVSIENCNDRMRDALARLAEIAADQTVFVLVENVEFDDPDDMLKPTSGRPENAQRLFDWLIAQGYESIGDTALGLAEMVAISKG